MADRDTPEDESTVRILDAHLLTGPRPGQCRCGWGNGDLHTLGLPHSRHVAEQLRAAGVLASAIPEKMRRAAIDAAKGDPEIETMAGRGAGVFYALPYIVDVALSAALAGRTVVELPEPDVNPDRIGCIASWTPSTWTIIASTAYSGAPVVDDDDRIMSADAAERHGLALIAAAHAARLRAAGSGVGDQT